MTMYLQLPRQLPEPVDPGPGRHFWMINIAYGVADDVARRMAEGTAGADAVKLSHENLVIPPQVGCYKCERPFSARLYGRPCTGSMDPLR